MIFNKTEEQEKEYLKQITGLLKSLMNETNVSVKEHVDTLQEYKDYLWSNKDIDPHEIRSMRESILNHLAVGESVIDKRKRLSKILDVPYFGRIDFCEENHSAQKLPIYIGVHSFYDSRTQKNLIYDWRAPVSGMFYDDELGSASYVSPQGEVRGRISLKRQYRIRRGQMEFMIESSLTIRDDVLQKELSSNADDKMKNIVATIQREQNGIIRNEEAHTLIIQGVPGSGKTSIALHRMAYLLYAMKENLASANILIVSPNKVFADYISTVLPELGEETVPQTTMEQIMLDVLNHKYKYQTCFQQVDELLEHKDSAFAERIRYKAAADFTNQIDRFILFMEKSFFQAEDVRLTNHLTVPAEFIAEQFHRFNRYPMRLRFEAMTDYIVEMLRLQYGVTVTASQRTELRKKIKKMFAGNNDLDVYKAFYDWMGAPEMFKIGRNRVLEYADLAPLAYLHLALEGCRPSAVVKHLLIDEMQDYSPVQYRIIQKLYPCRKTVLGDAGQSVNPYGSSTADMIQRTLAAGDVVKLGRSYRSTYEIMSFSQRIRRNKDLVSVERHGTPPRVTGFKSATGERAALIDLIASFQESEYQSLGIICKTEAMARELSQHLKNCGLEVHFISSLSSAFVRGVMVTSAHMAKGLEFDEVIVPQVNRDNYCSELDRCMLYVAVTRAMHQLVLTYCGSPSLFIGSV